MTDRIVLDSGPLGQLAHPRVAEAAARWLVTMLDSDCVVFVAEIADYEVRRELLRAGKPRSLERLDELRAELDFIPLDTPTMLRAAELWAEARRCGRPTADRHALDVDAILAAQAQRVGAAVATNNIGHLGQFVEARHWRDLGFHEPRE